MSAASHQESGRSPRGNPVAPKPLPPVPFRLELAIRENEEHLDNLISTITREDINRSWPSEEVKVERGNRQRSLFERIYLSRFAAGKSQVLPPYSDTLRKLIISQREKEVRQSCQVNPPFTGKLLEINMNKNLDFYGGLYVAFVDRQYLDKAPSIQMVDDTSSFLENGGQHLSERWTHTDHQAFDRHPVEAGGDRIREYSVDRRFEQRFNFGRKMILDEMFSRNRENTFILVEMFFMEVLSPERPVRDVHEVMQPLLRFAEKEKIKVAYINHGQQDPPPEMRFDALFHMGEYGELWGVTHNIDLTDSEIITTTGGLKDAFERHFRRDRPLKEFRYPEPRMRRPQQPAQQPPSSSTQQGTPGTATGRKRPAPGGDSGRLSQRERRNQGIPCRLPLGSALGRIRPRKPGSHWYPAPRDGYR